MDTKEIAERVAKSVIAGRPTIDWLGVPSAAPSYIGSPSDQSLDVSFSIFQDGDEYEEGGPGDNYVRSGFEPGTEFIGVTIYKDGKPIKVKKTWRDGQWNAAKAWCLKVLQGRVKVRGLKLAKSVVAGRVYQRETVKVDIGLVEFQEGWDERNGLDHVRFVVTGLGSSPWHPSVIYDRRRGKAKMDTTGMYSDLPWVIKELVLDMTEREAKKRKLR